MNERVLIELLDKKHRGALTADEAAQLQHLLEDDSFRVQAEKHLKFTNDLRDYGSRLAMYDKLDEFHETLEAEGAKPVKTVRLWKRYRATFAVAASVALISALCTWWLTSTTHVNQDEYIALRKKVDQINRSQAQIINDIRAKEKQEKVVVPEKYSGTGFLISSDGFAVTAYHVVKGADSVYISNEKLGNRKAIVIFSDEQKDLALLRLEGEELDMSALPFVIKNTEADLGEDVFTLGYSRPDIVFGNGTISAMSGYHENPEAYQISIPVNPGNSGGPLLNAKGDLIGIISGVQTGTSGAAFAVKSTTLHDVIRSFQTDSLNKTIVLPRQNTLRTARVEQVRKWKDFVFMVRVYNNQ